VTVTLVALVAVTVNWEDPPMYIVGGLAVMATVGATFAATVIEAVAAAAPPGPLAVAV
jgi:hypothetical protein